MTRDEGDRSVLYPTPGSTPVPFHPILYVEKRNGDGLPSLDLPNELETSPPWRKEWDAHLHSPSEDLLEDYLVTQPRPVRKRSAFGLRPVLALELRCRSVKAALALKSRLMYRRDLVLYEAHTHPLVHAAREHPGLVDPFPVSPSTPYRVMVWDLEVLGVEGFPNPKKKEDHIVLAGWSVHDFTMEGGLGKPVAEGVIEEWQAEGEMNLIHRLFALIDLFQVSEMIGHNSIAFDFDYLMTRHRLGCSCSRNPFSPFPGAPLPEVVVDKDIRSNMTFHWVVGSVVQHTCFLQWLRKNYEGANYDDHKLQTVATKEFGVGKLPGVEGYLLSEWIQEAKAGDEEKRRLLVEYCRRDVEITARCVDRLGVLGKGIEMCRLLRMIPNSYHIHRVMDWMMGWGLPHFMEKGGLEDAILPSYPKKKIERIKKGTKGVMETVRIRDTMEVDNNIAYKGATVLEPEEGVHGPLVSFDYDSLYPSTMREKNICITTMRVNPRTRRAELSDMVVNGKTFTVTQHVPRSERVGVIPAMVEYFVLERKKVKREMKDLEEGSGPWNVLEYRQLALKLAANSTYGALGSPAGWVACRPMAQMVTAGAREQIYFAIDVLHQLKRERPELGLDKEIYGDTDSLYIRMRSDLSLEDAEKNSMVFAKTLRERHQEIYGEDTFFNMKFEEISKAGLFTKKMKNYVLWRKVKDGSLKLLLHGNAFKGKGIPGALLVAIKDGVLLLMTRHPDKGPYRAHFEEVARKIMEDEYGPRDLALSLTYRAGKEGPAKEAVKHFPEDRPVRPGETFLAVSVEALPDEVEIRGILEDKGDVFGFMVKRGATQPPPSKRARINAPPKEIKVTKTWVPLEVFEEEGSGLKLRKKEYLRLLLSKIGGFDAELASDLSEKWLGTRVLRGSGARKRSGQVSFEADEEAVGEVMEVGELAKWLSGGSAPGSDGEEEEDWSE